MTLLPEIRLNVPRELGKTASAVPWLECQTATSHPGCDRLVSNPMLLWQWEKCLSFDQAAAGASMNIGFSFFLLPVTK